MGKTGPHITSAELKILKELWQLGSGTVRDVRERLEEAGESPAYTTVMTLMNQLAEKGVVRVDKTRQPFVYEPALRREQVLGQRLMQFVSNVFDGQAGELVMRLIEEGEISVDDLRRIEKKIEAKEKGAAGTDEAAQRKPEGGAK